MHPEQMPGAVGLGLAAQPRQALDGGVDAGHELQDLLVLVAVEAQGWAQASDRHLCSNRRGDDLRYELVYSQQEEGQTPDRHRLGTRQAPNVHTFLGHFVVGFKGLHNAPIGDLHQLEKHLVRQPDSILYTCMYM